MRDTANETADAITKMSWPAGVTVYNVILDMPIEKWVAVFTLIYIGLQVYLLIRDRLVRRKRRTDKE
jgi:hypothetical protein